MSIRLKDSISGPLSGNATTATTLQTARTINGTNFNGSANITTANWGTARTLTIGNTGKSVNGSANVSWSLSEIGAAASSHDHSNYVSGTGNSAVTNITEPNLLWKSGFYEINNDGTIKNNAPFSGWNWLIHAGHTSNRSDYRYGMQIAGQNNTNNFAIRTTNVNGEGTWNTLYHTGNKPTPSEIGAAASSHSHSYLPLSGGTLTGPLYIGNGLSSSGTNNSSYSRIVRTSTDTGSSVKFQFGKGESTFEIIDSSWSKAFFSVGSNDWIGINGTAIVSSGSGSTGRWVRFYDGTQICWGELVYSSGNCAMNTAAANNVWGGVNTNIYYPVTFTTKPSVSVSVATNGYTDCQATSVTTTLFLARAWGNYSTTVNHLYFSWTAIGRWK